MSLEGCLLNHECSVCSKTHILCHKFPFIHCFDCIHKLRFMPFGEFSNCDLLDYRLFRSILISKTIHFLSYIFLTLYHFGRNRQSSWYFLVCFFFLSCGVSHFPPVMVGFSCLCSQCGGDVKSPWGDSFPFLSLWLCWVFIPALGVSLVVGSRGYSSLWCSGFSLWWLLLLSGCGTQAWFLHATWELPEPGTEPASPTLAGGFLTTGPSG